MNDADLREAQAQVERDLRKVLSTVDTVRLKGYRVIAHIKGNKLISTELVKRG